MKTHRPLSILSLQKIDSIVLSEVDDLFFTSQEYRFHCPVFAIFQISETRVEEVYTSYLEI